MIRLISKPMNAFFKLLLILLIGALWSPLVCAQLPTANVLRRVFAVRIGEITDTAYKTGTAFTIDVDSKQYLVTARHLFEDTASVKQILIANNQKWVVQQLKLVAPLTDSLDIAVFALPQRLSFAPDLPPTSEGLRLGEEVFFMGFPSLLRTKDEGGINEGFPFPFTKHAIISAKSTDSLGNPIWYLDGHNNPGFSGGPVVFWHHKLKKFCLIGVVQAYKPEQLYERISKDEYKPTNVWGNSGIVVVIDISNVLRLIAKNPIGAEIVK